MQDLNDLSQYKRIAIMGGTFDPIHFGHLLCAEMVYERFQAEKMIFIPSGKPPHKQGFDVTLPDIRLFMTCLAIKSHPHFSISDYETGMERLSYTYETLRYFKKCAPNSTLYFLSGADAIAEILNWNRPEEIFALSEFIALFRPGYRKKKLFANINHLKKKYGAKIHFMEIPGLAISSTDIRNRFLFEEPVRCLLPDEVIEFIQLNHLYMHSEYSDVPVKEMKKKLQESLSYERYIHSLAVKDEAALLAKHYKIDPKKAMYAGLLHDCAKKMSMKESFSVIEKAEMKVDENLYRYPKVIHQFAGAAVAKMDYNITDKDILHAISYHTTGRPNMSTLEKIIYLADLIEPNRSYKGVSYLRELAYTDLNLAMKNALLKVKGMKNIYPLSLEAKAFYHNE